MEHVDELIAGQALYALSEEDSERVALHAAECEPCRRHLREAEAIAASLAYAVPTLAPPPDLRDRVLAAVEPVVSAPPATVAPAPRPRRPLRAAWWPRFALVATPVLAAAVLGLLVWNVSLRGDLNSLTGNLQRGHAVRLGNIGTVVTKAGGRSTLYASIARAPAGMTYEAWVIHGQVAVPAGLFDGGGKLTLKLTTPVKPGDVIAITVEPAGGTKTPTAKPIAHQTI
ncbi:MAG: anti-sigma factor [Gaiellales bacterium]